jgi:hypothetical protein
MKGWLLYIVLLLTVPVYAQDSSDTETIDGAEYEFETTEDEQSFEESETPLLHELRKPEELPSTKEYKSEQVHHKTFDEAKWREVIGDNDFKQERPEMPDFSMPNLAWGGILLKAIGFGLIIAIIVLLLYFVFRHINFSAKRKITPITPYDSQDEEDIQQMDIPALLKQALAEKNFKLAVRLYFLSLLKNLDQAGMIQWERDKTNRDYLRELFSREEYYDDVQKLTRTYEEVWYGDYALPEAALLSIIQKFEALNTRLNPVKNL